MNESSELHERIIRFNPWKILLLFVPLGVLVAISLYINFDSWRDADLWVYLVFGGIILFLLFSFVVMPFRHYLRLAPEGLTIQYLTHQKFYSWDEVSNFRVVARTVNATPAGNRVVWDLALDSPHRSGLVEMAAALNRYDASLMASYSMSAAEIAQLLNTWQLRYGRPATEQRNNAST